MVANNYSNIAVETALASGIASGDLSLTVTDASGWPASPFVLVIDPDTASEELIRVGAKAGTTFSSLTRGYGGTSAAAHNAPAVIKHVIPAEDHRLIWEHIHKTATDGTAQVSHDDLSGVSPNDHHNELHTVDSHSDTGATGAELNTLTDGSDADALHTHPSAAAALAAHVAAADEHPAYATDADLTAHAAAADPHTGYVLDATLAAHEAAAIPHAIEVDGSIEVASPPAMGTSMGIKATVTLAIPVGWGSWKCEAYATFDYAMNSGFNFQHKIRIDGTDQQTQFITPLTVNNSGSGAVGGRRTGMITTGNRDISLLASASGTAQMGRVYLYARAVRTS